MHTTTLWPPGVLLAALVTLSPALPLGSGDALPVLGAPAAPAGGPGALVHYARVALVENAGLDLTHYPVLVPLDSAAPISEGKMRPDCGDVRFLDAATLAPLPHWLEGGCGTAEARFWVLIEDLPRSPVPKPVLVTYGNAALDSASDGAAVLDAYATFDDGTLDGWRNADVETVIPPYPAEFRDDYPPAIVDAIEGRPAGSARKGPERSDNPQGHGSAGIARAIALPSNVNLTIGLDYRAHSTYAGSTVTNALVAVGTGDEPLMPGSELARTWLVRGGVTDSGWRRADLDALPTLGHEAITVFLGTSDLWNYSGFQKAVWFDNVAVRRVANPEPSVTVLPESPAPAR